MGALKPKAKSPEIDAAKDARIVMSDRVRLLHAHEEKRSALVKKGERATEAITRHKTALEKAVLAEKERHERDLKAIKVAFARMVRAEEESIAKTKEALRIQKESYDHAEEDYVGYVAKQIPAEPAITSDMIGTDMIA